ncbi:Acetyl-/propionyl-coenzyme A carboxylase alpha chain [bacterium HR40]|nr:Acetyl-/propionyl-coenzyme A carboxylase alpha chain [bacterium HR40]
MFRSLLVANRGEIACRIFRTCQRLGIRTIAVFSDADRDAPHVRAADVAVRIGPPPAADSYLRIDRILEAARRTGAEAIHPGYGFLSERPAFARAVRDAGLVFVGPSPEAMELLGAKDTARRLAVEAGVPILPGYDGELQDEGVLQQQARAIGLPLLIKAAAGGGGRGMRRVERLEDLAEALAAARREAEAAFGDGRLLLERRLEAPRHVEVQVFGDGRGGALHLFERDCSLQRRHQKIVEEAPAPGLDEATRAALGEAAVTLVRHARYANAGTVEFLVDGSGRFFFIEMNTRLQVEHPVTEAITGLDLVEWQLRLAAGESLPLSQEDVRCHGHAFEARVYAEDPARDFAPSTGRIERLALAHGCREVRIDSAIDEGAEIGPFYDPMIAKLIVHGPDRKTALGRLERALDRSAVLGVATNLDLLRRVVRSEAFRRGEVDTGWLERGEGQSLLVPAPRSPRLLALAALAEVARRRHAFERWDATHPQSPWDVADGFRLAQPARHLVRLDDGSGERSLLVESDGDGWLVHAPQGRLRARLNAYRPPLVEIEEEGLSRPVLALFGSEELAVVDEGEAAIFSRPGTVEHAGEDDRAIDVVTSPLPGRLVRICVTAGESVVRGQLLALLEAMKMEQKILAPRDGRVAEVRVEAGEQVQEGTVLIVLEPGEETA